MYYSNSVCLFSPWYLIPLVHKIFEHHYIPIAIYGNNFPKYKPLFQLILLSSQSLWTIKVNVIDLNTQHDNQLYIHVALGILVNVNPNQH